MRSSARSSAGSDLLGGRVLWKVNSTARGGGVAEMLRSLIGYCARRGIDARWVVIGGDAEFFALTKRLHNRLHGCAGDGGPLGDAERARLRARRRGATPTRSCERVSAGDVVLLHDPQTAGMIAARSARRGVPVVWRAHIGLDMPNDLARAGVGLPDGPTWSRRTPTCSRVRRTTWEGLDHDRVTVIPPSIDAFSPKNQAIGFTASTPSCVPRGLAADERHGARAGVRAARRSTGAGRARGAADRGAAAAAGRAAGRAGLALGPPEGPARACWRRSPSTCTPTTGGALLLAGPDVDGVADDPEGAEVLAEVEAAWHELPRDVRRRVHLALPADGRRRRERGDRQRPAAARRRRRAEEPRRGLRADGRRGDVEGPPGRRLARRRHPGPDRGRADRLPRRARATSTRSATRVAALLADPPTAERIGAAAQARVRDLFLGPRHLGQWVDLLERVASP